MSSAPRGQQRGTPGHGRARQSDLPALVEVVELDCPTCPQCGLSLGEFPGTEDSQVLEIEVKAYRRVIRRRRYRPMCDCGWRHADARPPVAGVLVTDSLV